MEIGKLCHSSFILTGSTFHCFVKSNPIVERVNIYPPSCQSSQHILNEKRKHFKVDLRIQVSDLSLLSEVQYGELEALYPQILEMRNASLGRREFHIRMFFIRTGIGKTHVLECAGSWTLLPTLNSPIFSCRSNKAVIYLSQGNIHK